MSPLSSAARPYPLRGWAVLLPVLMFAGVPAWAGRPAADVTPLHYQLTLEPDPAAASFTGDLAIDLKVDTPTLRLTLRAVDLSVVASDVTLPWGKVLKPVVAADARAQTLTFTLPTRLRIGTARLHVEYSGRLDGSPAGLRTIRAGGRQYVLALAGTAGPRSIFPCFDEPAPEASFAVAVVAGERDTAISNGPLLSDTPGPRAGAHTLRFAVTPRMSPRLVALAVGEFQCLEGSGDAVPVRVCSVPDAAGRGRFALDAARSALHLDTEYFTVRYPFRKLDLVALPGVSASAAEAAGIVLADGSALLLDEASASRPALLDTALTVSRAVARQWLGDMVTLRSPDDGWVEEGLARWMALKSVAAWKPDWRADLAGVAMAGRAMDADALVSSRALRPGLATSAGLDSTSGGPLCDKAAAIVRMVENYVGEASFRTAVNQYLRAHAYATASAEDFWMAVAGAANRPVDRVAASFADRPGVPLVAIETRCEGTSKTIVEATQRKLPATGKGSPGGTWYIPLGLRPLTGTAADPVATELLTGVRQTFTLDGCTPVVFANAGGLGYYRSVYDPAALERLTAVALAQLSPAERLRLASDERALVGAGVHPPTTYMALARELARDSSPEVLEEIARGLASVQRLPQQ